jgi:hypothetical protein
VINAGNLRMTNNNASLSCNGCTIILTSFGNNGATTGTVNLNGGNIDLKPPRSSGGTQIGPAAWNGYTFYQDPRAVDDGSTAQNKINGNSSLSVQGIVYFGNQSLEFVGGGNAAAACLQIVAARVTFSGSSNITAGSACASMGMGGIGGTRRVRLVA